MSSVLTNQETESLTEIIREEAGSTIFRVRFVKRTTGEVRDMVCRLGVRKGLSGAGQKYDPVSKGLLTVYDVQREGWRAIPLENIISVQIRGTVYNGPRKE